MRLLFSFSFAGIFFHKCSPEDECDHKCYKNKNCFVFTTVSVYANKEVRKLIYKNLYNKCHTISHSKWLQQKSERGTHWPSTGHKVHNKSLFISSNCFEDPRKEVERRKLPAGDYVMAKRMNENAYYVPQPPAVLAYERMPRQSIADNSNSATTNASVSALVAATAFDSANGIANDFNYTRSSSSSNSFGSDVLSPSNLSFSYFLPAASYAIPEPESQPTTFSVVSNDVKPDLIEQTNTLLLNNSSSEISDDMLQIILGPPTTTTTVSAGAGAGAGAVDGTSDKFNSFYFYETEQFAVLWILFAVIVLGNSTVLFVMFVNKNRKSRMNYFIKQLAIADLSVGLLHVLTDIIWRITISWRAGNMACKLIRFSQVCVTYSSTYVLVAMSIDRYDAITHPMNFSKSWRRARHLVAAAWTVSALFSLPILILYEEKLIQGQMQCWIELGSPQAWQVYMCLVSASLFVVPAMIITACYAIIVKTIWAKGSNFIPAERSGYNNAATRRASSRGIIPRAKVKTVKMTFVIVIVFIVCWSPYIIFDLLQVFGYIPQTQANIAIATFIQSLAPLNSAANPLIYCLFSSQVFRTLRKPNNCSHINKNNNYHCTP
ncbi:cardioacceleratory peptide receptor isoform X2 [Rhagoletis pomonella]|uniref:cardioacceleratory peptide receptor isoform X2 n=1 Tax=Rhagoletis pomonella TaxID=28610 RepID=UPI001786689E|nr:cardioacceleratory peptide receptor isoform X2 [Rhagoletis pomonella]